MILRLILRELVTAIYTRLVDMDSRAMLRSMLDDKLELVIITVGPLATARFRTAARAAAVISPLALIVPVFLAVLEITFFVRVTQVGWNRH